MINKSLVWFQTELLDSTQSYYHYLNASYLVDLPAWATTVLNTRHGLHRSFAILFVFLCVSEPVPNPQKPLKGYDFPRWYPCELLVGLWHLLLQILTLFQTKKCIFSHPYSDLASKIHTRFQTWRLRNYFIITLIRTRTKKISLSFYLIWNWNNEYVRTLLRVSSRTVPDSRPKWTKSLPVFRPRRRKNPTLWGGTYIFGLYMGVPRPPGFSIFPKKNQSVRFILTGV